MYFCYTLLIYTAVSLHLQSDESAVLSRLVPFSSTQMTNEGCLAVATVMMQLNVASSGGPSTWNHKSLELHMTSPRCDCGSRYFFLSKDQASYDDADRHEDDV